MKSFTTVIDVVERGLEETFSNRTINQHNGIDAKRRKKIALEYLTYEENEQLLIPEKLNNEVFPYVHPRWILANKLGASGYVKSVDNVVVSANIKTLLLYYHRLAISNGFGHLCDYYQISDFVNPQIDSKFDSYLKLFLELKPLIDEGIVFFMPEQNTLGKAIKAVERLEIPPWLTGPDCLLRDILEQSLWIGKEHNLDFMVPNTNIVSNFLEDYFQNCGHSLQGEKIKESQIGSFLLECQLPNLPDLTLSDITLIRKNNDDFAAWRSRLRNILTVFYQDSKKERFDQNLFARYAYEELAQGRMEIMKAVKKSNSLDQIQKGLKNIGIGIISGVMMAPVAPLPAAILTVLATSGSTFLWEYLFNNKSDDHNRLKTLSAHYALFDQKINSN